MRSTAANLAGGCDVAENSGTGGSPVVAVLRDIRGTYRERCVAEADGGNPSNFSIAAMASVLSFAKKLPTTFPSRSIRIVVG